MTKKVKSFAKADYTKKLNGWKTLVLENENISVTVLPEYGGWIKSVFFKPRNVELLWQHPRGLCAKDDPPVVSNPLQAYRARSLGAWPEIFPHGSGPVDVDGVQMPMHGETFNRSWKCGVLKSRSGEAAAKLEVECHLQPLRLERVMRVLKGTSTVILEETATNYSNDPVEFMWGHHPLFGKPLYSGKSRIHAPAKQSRDDDMKARGWPVHEGKDLSMCPAEGSGSGEMFYLDPLSDAWCALVNPDEKLGVALRWDLSVFPVVWIWREANKSRGYPYFGRAYAVAIEPFSSLPGARQNGGRLLRLEGGRSMTSRLMLTAFQGLTSVSAVSADGAVTA